MNISRKLLAILVLAAVLRIFALAIIRDAHVPWVYEFEEIAINLAESGEYAYSFYGLSETQPSSFLPPVYPLLLAALLKLSAGELTLLAPLQILLSCLSVYVLFLLVQALSGGKVPALLASLMMAVYPPLIVNSVLPSTVTLETLFVLVGLLITLLAAQRSPVFGLVAGINLAAAGLTRSPWLLLIPIAFIWSLWVARNGTARRYLLPVLILLGAAITLAPWIYFNQQTHGAWLLGSTNGGMNFWIGNNPQATGEFIFPTQIDRPLVMQTVDWSELERDQFFYQQGFDYLREHPIESANLAIRKLTYFIFFRPSIGSSYQATEIQVGLASKLFIAAWLAILPFGIFGILKTWTQDRGHFLLLSAFVSQGVVAMLFFAGTRFRTPLDPLVILWAALGLPSILHNIHVRLFPSIDHA